MKYQAILSMLPIHISIVFLGERFRLYHWERDSARVE